MSVFFLCEPQHHLRLVQPRRTTHRFTENHTGALPLHTNLTTTAKLSHASKSERINRNFEISSTIDPHRHQGEGFAQTSPLSSESFTRPPTSETKETRVGDARHKTPSPPGVEADNDGTVGASTFRKLSRRRKAEEAFTTRNLCRIFHFAEIKAGVGEAVEASTSQKRNLNEAIYFTAPSTQYDRVFPPEPPRMGICQSSDKAEDQRRWRSDPGETS
ncbi:hypothetical protein F2Q69_00062587 [Brassica cretica]|uniref:Uncharacterized protein n=1 Tax=Brassica cretica TaxID=69181 RepID=A0A8S9RGX3_BRACR|nr:hypothetical protein F2Q69_00062587 [Brassica cretica]